MTWFKQQEAGILLHCIILPKSSKTQIVGLYGVPQRLKIKVAAPPVDGKANEALIAYLAKCLGIPKKQIRIISGDSGKYKDVLVFGIKESALLQLDKTETASDTRTSTCWPKNSVL